MPQFNKSILAMHAHPDDTEAFCAGTLKLLKERGYRITIATFTAGGLGSVDFDEEATILRRTEEARKAAAALDAEYFCLSGQDGYLYDTPALRLGVTSLIRRVKAGIVMTHLPMDYHGDHRAACNITESAAIVASLPNVPVPEEPAKITPLLYHTAPLGFSDPLGGEVIPPHFALDITSVMETKKKMLAFHQSQIELMRVMHGMDDFFGEMERYNAELGSRAGCRYAEVYWQHLGGGFQKDPIIQNELADYMKPFH